MTCIEAYTLIDPDTILPRHWFLCETDFEALGSGPTSHCLLWLSEVNTALLAATLSEMGNLTP